MKVTFVNTNAIAVFTVIESDGQARKEAGKIKDIALMTQNMNTLVAEDRDPNHSIFFRRPKAKPASLIEQLVESDDIVTLAEKVREENTSGGGNSLMPWLLMSDAVRLIRSSYGGSCEIENIEFMSQPRHSPNIIQELELTKLVNTTKQSAAEDYASVMAAALELRHINCTKSAILMEDYLEAVAKLLADTALSRRAVFLTYGVGRNWARRILNAADIPEAVLDNADIDYLNADVGIGADVTEFARVDPAPVHVGLGDISVDPHLSVTDMSSVLQMPVETIKDSKSLDPAVERSCSRAEWDDLVVNALACPGGKDAVNSVITELTERNEHAPSEEQRRQLYDEAVGKWLGMYDDTDISYAYFNVLIAELQAYLATAPEKEEAVERVPTYHEYGDTVNKFLQTKLANGIFAASTAVKVHDLFDMLGEKADDLQQAWKNKGKTNWKEGMRERLIKMYGAVDVNRVGFMKAYKSMKDTIAADYATVDPTAPATNWNGVAVIGAATIGSAMKYAADKIGGGVGGVVKYVSGVAADLKKDAEDQRQAQILHRREGIVAKKFQMLELIIKEIFEQHNLLFTAGFKNRIAAAELDFCKEAEFYEDDASTTLFDDPKKLRETYGIFFTKVWHDHVLEEYPLLSKYTQMAWAMWMYEEGTKMIDFRLEVNNFLSAAAEKTGHDLPMEIAKILQNVTMVAHERWEAYLVAERGETEVIRSQYNDACQYAVFIRDAATEFWQKAGNTIEGLTVGTVNRRQVEDMFFKMEA